MADILPRVKEKYIIDAQQTSILPLLDIGKKREIGTKEDIGANGGKK